MNPFRLTHYALDDLESLLYSLAEHSGWDASMRMEEKLFASFDLLAANPGIGHLKTDLIARDVYFYYSAPYLVIYRRETQPMVIVAVIHGSRDVGSILRERIS